MEDNIKMDLKDTWFFHDSTSLRVLWCDYDNKPSPSIKDEEIWYVERLVFSQKTMRHGISYMK
jgi:hypothetical protein